MPNLNRVLLIGNLTRDPEVKFTNGGKAIANFGLAINHNYTTASGEKREEVTFVDIEAWGKPAEIIGQYCKKGRPLFIEGRLRLDTWDDKTTGQKRSKMKVVVDNFQLLGSKPPEGGDDTQGEEKPRERANLPARRPAPPADPDLDPPDEEQFMG